MISKKNRKLLNKQDYSFNESEWREILKSTDPEKLYKVSNKRIRESLISGIPSSLRGAIWCFLCRARHHRDQYDTNFYDKLTSSEFDNEKVKKDIDKDIPRTMSADITEKLKEKLTNVLYAYAKFDLEIGYTQGMNLIVYMLLTYIDNEEMSFWCLYDIMYNKNWRLV